MTSLFGRARTDLEAALSYGFGLHGCPSILVHGDECTPKVSTSLPMCDQATVVPS
jgi:hypothetical protein